MVSLSVCTLARGRDAHLANLVRGLAAQTTPPVELVVAAMQDRPYDLPATDFPVRQLILGRGAMNLAAARNAAARAAVSDRLAFLDVDCIPDPDFVADLHVRLGTRDGLVMGEILYLPEGATDQGLDFARFTAIGEKHSERAGPPETPIELCADYRCFWSLNFAMRRETFLSIGGFDEDYVGYGGEDTDFGRVVATAGVPIFWVQGARAFHQYHPHHMPPVHHVASVVANARRFRDKWGEWTMPHWLRCFELMGLIARDGDDYVVLRDPDEADLALTRQQSHQPYASSAKVLALLESAPASAAA